MIKMDTETRRTLREIDLKITEIKMMINELDTRLKAVEENIEDAFEALGLTYDFVRDRWIKIEERK